jgi:hypothetical protein
MGTHFSFVETGVAGPGSNGSSLNSSPLKRQDHGELFTGRRPVAPGRKLLVSVAQSRTRPPHRYEPRAILPSTGSSPEPVREPRRRGFRRARSWSYRARPESVPPISEDRDLEEPNDSGHALLSQLGPVTLLRNMEFIGRGPAGDQEVSFLTYLCRADQMLQERPSQASMVPLLGNTPVLTTHGLVTPPTPCGGNPRQPQGHCPCDKFPHDCMESCGFAEAHRTSEGNG